MKGTKPNPTSRSTNPTQVATLDTNTNTNITQAALVSATATINTSCSNCKRSQDHTLQFVLHSFFKFTSHHILKSTVPADPNYQYGSYTCNFCKSGNGVYLQMSELVSVTTSAEVKTRTYAPSVTQRPVFNTQEELHKHLANDEKANTRVVTTNEKNQDFLKMTVITTCGNPNCKKTGPLELNFVSVLWLEPLSSFICS
jgi:hypothetical protein